MLFFLYCLSLITVTRRSNTVGRATQLLRRRAYYWFVRRRVFKREKTNASDSARDILRGTYIYKLLYTCILTTNTRNPVFRTINTPKSRTDGRKEPKNIRPVYFFYYYSEKKKSFVSFEFVLCSLRACVCETSWAKLFFFLTFPSQTARVSDDGKPTKILPPHKNVLKKTCYCFDAPNMTTTDMNGNSYVYCCYFFPAAVWLEDF